MLNHEPARNPHSRIYTLLITFLLFVSATAIEASQLSIVDPVNTWIDTITGPIAFGFGILVMVVAGLMLGFGRADIQQFAITSGVTVLVLAIVFFARPLIRELFGPSSTPAAALLGF